MAQRAKSHAERKAGRDGYFAPESVIRRVGSSPLVPLLGAGPAVLFQVAHPLVAASVVARPDFRLTLWPRWLHTVRALYLMVYGSREEADRTGEAVQAAHRRVQGATTSELGPFPAGTPFSAADPALMLWVHGALVEVSLAVHRRFVRRLTRAEERCYYREMGVVARLVGMPAGALPPTLEEFRHHLCELLQGPEVVVTPPAREIAAALFGASLPTPVRPLLPAHRLATAGLLPPGLRAQYEFAWSPGRAAALGLAGSSLRAAAAPLLFALERIPLAA